MSDTARERRLWKIIANSLNAAQPGERTDGDALPSQHPDLADDLRSFFANHDRMRADARAAAPDSRSG